MAAETDWGNNRKSIKRKTLETYFTDTSVTNLIVVYMEIVGVETTFGVSDTNIF